MPYDPLTHDRRSLRLPSYDYAGPGAYFITICTHNRAHTFSNITDGVMQLSAAGEIVAHEWQRSAGVRNELSLGAFVVMPNHLHGIINDARPESARANHVNTHTECSTLADPQRLRLLRPPRSLGAFVAGFKSAATVQINAARGTPGLPVWQRGYHEHIIRNDDDLDRIHDYIALNPARWADDRYHTS